MEKEIEPDDEPKYTVSLRLESWVGEQDVARFVQELVDGLNLDQLGFKGHTCKVGRPGYAASLMLKIWVYGYLENIISTRLLEQACIKDTGMMLLVGCRHPDHNTIWRFFDSNREALHQLFLKVIQMGIKGGLITMKLQAIDGTKMAADVSPTRALILSDLEKLYTLLTGLDPGAIKADPALACEKKECCLPVYYQNKFSIKQLLNGGSISETQRSQLCEPVVSEIKRLKALGMNQMSLNDPDARVMKGSRGQTFFSYNAQAVVDEETLMIVAARVTQDELDNHLLCSMIQEAERNTGQVCQESVADGGYESGEELEQIQEKGYRVVLHIKKSGEDCPDHPGFGKQNFTYDEKKDVYLCPGGRELPFEREKDGHSQWHKMRIYRCHPRSCASRQACTKQKRGRTIERSPCEKAKEDYLAHRDPAHDRELLQKRKTIIEPVFGWIKRNNRITHWSFRGLKKVQAQWIMICMVINLKKMLKRWQSGQLELSQCF